MNSGATVSIRAARDSDEIEWNDFVESHPNGTPFHLTGWSRAVGSALGHRTHHLVAVSGGRFVGILPLVQVRSALTGNRLISTPLAGYGGPLAVADRVADELVIRSRTLTRELNAGHLELHVECEDLVPTAARGLPASDLYCGFSEELPPSPDDVIGWLPRPSRRMVRLGDRAGLTSQVHRLTAHETATSRNPRWLVDAHRLVAATMRDLGTPSYSIRMLRQLLAEDPERWFVWAIYGPDGNMTAAVWVARHGDTVYPHFSGASREHRKVGVNNFLYAKLMEAMIAEGVRIFDFGRSKVDSGPYHFKRHFGFQPRPLGYRYDMTVSESLPTTSSSDPRYALAVRLWQRLPLPVTRTLGPTLVGHFV